MNTRATMIKELWLNAVAAVGVLAAAMVVAWLTMLVF